MPGAFSRLGELTLGRLARAALVDALARWQIGDLTVHLPDGSVLRAGTAGDSLRATLWIEREAFFRKMAVKGPQWIGEFYMDGDWHADDVARFLEIAMRNHAALPETGPIAWFANAINSLLHRGEPNTRTGSRNNIHRHYDLSNALFELFLDETMTYSSGIYETGEESLFRRRSASTGHSARNSPSDRMITCWRSGAAGAGSRCSLPASTAPA